MKTQKFLNGFLALGLLVAAALFLGVASPAFAEHDAAPPALPADERLNPDDNSPGFDVDPVDRRIELMERARQHTGDNKILFDSVAPGTVISHYVVEGSETSPWTSTGEPAGLLQGSAPVPADGKPASFFAPVSGTDSGPAAKVSNFFSWSPDSGWTLLDSVIPLPSSQDTTL